jgi:uncharacterized membrane protein
LGTNTYTDSRQKRTNHVTQKEKEKIMATPKTFQLLGHTCKYLWNIFLSGFITLLPITITFVIFNMMFSVLSRWLEPIQRLLPPFIKTIPYSEFLVVIIAIVLIGILLKTLILKPIIHATERIISRIPLVRPVYQGIKQLVDAFGSQDKPTFKKVVIVEFPKAGVYSIGFVTSEVSPEYTPEKTQKFVSVFIPTTPNPTTGFLILLPETLITPVNLTPQDAMALIISGGIIQPDKFRAQSESGR